MNKHCEQALLGFLVLFVCNSLHCYCIVSLFSVPFSLLFSLSSLLSSLLMSTFQFSTLNVSIFARIFYYISHEWHVWVVFNTIASLLFLAAFMVWVFIGDIFLLGHNINVITWVLIIVASFLSTFFLLYNIASVNQRQNDMLKAVWSMKQFTVCERAALQQHVELFPLTFEVCGVSITHSRFANFFFSVCAVAVPFALRKLLLSDS